MRPFRPAQPPTEESGEPFFLPYGIDIDGDKIAVTDSGIASWETGTKTPGHSLQTFTRAAEAGSAGHGDYLGGGQYDIVNTKSGVADPHALVQPKALAYYAVGTPRGPRGVAYGSGDAVYGASYEGVSSQVTTSQMRQYSSDALGTPAATWGSSNFTSAGSLSGPVSVDTDAEGNVYTATNSGVSVSNASGQFQSALSLYFDQNGTDQSQRVAWATHMADVPREYGKPDLIGESYGLSVTQEDGKTVVYVGDAGSYYQPDPAVHFQSGSTAQYTKPASIKKYILTQSGGTVNARWNPSGWKWTLDTSFGTGGAVQYNQNVLVSVFGKYYFSGQTVFALEADPQSGSLYYALNGVSGKKLGALDLKTGNEIDPTPAPVNGPSTQQDSAMNYVRGIAVDDRGLVYATTQDTTTTATKRAVVQIWGKTPTSIAGTAAAVPQLTTSQLTWGESTVGYQQPDLLDYVVKYRKVGDTSWITAPVPGGSATSTALSRVLTGLTPATDYEAIITPFNEAGSGDPAHVTWRTEAPDPKITVVKSGNGVSNDSEGSAVHVAAGSEVSFSYVVTNSGNVPVTGVSLSDDKLGTVTAPAAFDGTLAANGGTVTFTATGPVAAGAYKNTATVTGESGGADVHDSDDWFGFGDTTGLTVVKSVDDSQLSSPAKPGDVLIYEFVATNTGTAELRGVTITDALAGLGEIAYVWPDASKPGVLAAGEKVTASAIYRLSESDVSRGDVVNKATADGVASDGTSVSASDEATVSFDTPTPTPTPTPAPTLNGTLPSTGMDGSVLVAGLWVGGLLLLAGLGLAVFAAVRRVKR